MQGIRRQGRSFALQLLYQVELTQISDEESLGRFWLTVDASAKAQQFALDLVRATLKHRAEIDKRLTANLEHWKLGRLSVVVRNVLRLAVCEMLMLKQTPPAVVINEAVDLTRSFMDEESAPFVNKVLEKCWQADGSKPPASGAEKPAGKRTRTKDD
ncbi:MAG: transcription antitermination factor NusB [SAR324 cluster bacterium]